MFENPVCVSSQVTGWLSNHVYPVQDGRTRRDHLRTVFGRIITVTLTAPLLLVSCRIEHFIYSILTTLTAPFLLWKRSESIHLIFRKLRRSASITTWWNLWNFTMLHRPTDLRALTFSNELQAQAYAMRQGIFQTPSCLWMIPIDITLLTYGLLMIYSETTIIALSRIYGASLSLFRDNIDQTGFGTIPRLSFHDVLPPPSHRTQSNIITTTSATRSEGEIFLNKYYTKELIGIKMYQSILEQDPGIFQFVAERCIYLLSIPLASHPVPNFLKETTVWFVHIFRAILSGEGQFIIPTSIHRIPNQWNTKTKGAIETFLCELKELNLTTHLQQIQKTRDLISILWDTAKIEAHPIAEIEKTKRQDLQKQVHHLLVTWADIMRLKTSPDLFFNALEQFFGAKYPLEEESLGSLTEKSESPLQQRLRLQIQMIANLEWTDHAHSTLTRTALQDFIRSHSS